MNVRDCEQTPLSLVFEAASHEADRLGAHVDLRREHFSPSMVLQNHLTDIIQL